MDGDYLRLFPARIGLRLGLRLRGRRGKRGVDETKSGVRPRVFLPVIAVLVVVDSVRVDGAGVMCAIIVLTPPPISKVRTETLHQRSRSTSIM